MPDWLIDGSANKFNNTYFRDAHGKDFAVDMSGNLIVRGRVGIGTDSPDNKLTVSGGAIQLSPFGDGGGTTKFAMYSHADVFFLNPRNSTGGWNNITGLSMKSNGYVGIGTTNPFCPLHIEGMDGGFSSSHRGFFHYGTWLTRNTGVWDGFGLYANKSIGTNNTFVSHAGTFSASDVRIKKNIIDVEDDSALTMLRTLKPKTYGYNDVINRGTETVYGFIAQEVDEIIPQSVQKREDCIPNIYQLATVGNDNKIMCFYQGFNTQDLDASSNTLKILDKEVKEHFVNIEEIIDASYIRVDIDLSDMMGDVDDSGNIIEGNKVFVYGQRVDDFHFLKKEAIFTVATAALQEVDRQLQAEKAKVATLESQVAALLAKYPVD